MLRLKFCALVTLFCSLAACGSTTSQASAQASEVSLLTPAQNAVLAEGVASNVVLDDVDAGVVATL